MSDRLVFDLGDGAILELTGVSIAGPDRNIQNSTDWYQLIVDENSQIVGNIYLRWNKLASKVIGEKIKLYMNGGEGWKRIA